MNNNKLSIRHVTALVLLSTIFILSACSDEKTPKADSNTSISKPIPITITSVETRDIERTVEMVGTLMSIQDQITVGTEIAGTVKEIYVDLGDRLKENQLLLLLDQRESRLATQQAEANLAAVKRDVERARAVMNDAKINFGRMKELFDKKIVSAMERDSAQTQYEVAVAQLNLARAKVEQATAGLNLEEKKLGDTEIRAPISGVISKRLVSIGAAVKEKTPVFVIVTLNPLKISGTVPERFAPEVQVEQKVKVSVEGFPGKFFPGEVKRISPQIDPETRSLTVEAEIPNLEEILKPGFFAKALIFTQKEKGVPFVPEEAVYYFIGITKVFVIEDGKALERIVKTGIHKDGKVEIIQGIKAGELVATSNLSQLANGVSVEVVKGTENKVK